MKRLVLVVVVLLFASAAYARRLEDIEARSLDAIFEQAAEESGVPIDILRAIAFVESRWSPHPAVVDGETGRPASYGIMGLRDDDWFGHSLVDAAAMIGRTPDELKRDRALNIRGAAALLAILGRGSEALEDWEEAVARYSGIPQPEIARIYTYDVFNAIREGRESERYHVERQPIDLERIYGAARLQILSAPRVTVKVSALSADYSPALWNPAASCNYTVGRTVPVTHVTIHTAEGSYAGTISWFQNCSAQVSAHYVVRSSDGQVTQMVLERDKAWHVGSENGYTVGIEHEGFMSAPSTWFTDAMYNASALLTRDICLQRHGQDQGLRRLAGLERRDHGQGGVQREGARQLSEPDASGPRLRLELAPLPEPRRGDERRLVAAPGQPRLRVGQRELGRRLVGRHHEFDLPHAARRLLVRLARRLGHGAHGLDVPDGEHPLHGHHRDAHLLAEGGHGGDDDHHGLRHAEGADPGHGERGEDAARDALQPERLLLLRAEVVRHLRVSRPDGAGVFRGEQRQRQPDVVRGGRRGGERAMKMWGRLSSRPGIDMGPAGEPALHSLTLGVFRRM
jgi:hypothetical protein